MKKIIAIRPKKSYNDFFHLNWMIHDRCTYDCSYCPPDNKKGKDDWLSIDFSKKFVDNLDNWVNASSNKKVIVSFSGGEPTVWPKFIELVNHINSKGWHVVLTTNGNRSVRWWNENHKKFIHISFSYHSEFVKDDEFLEKVNLASKNTKVFVNVMMNTRRWEQCVNFVEKLKEYPIKFKPRPLQENFGSQIIPISPYSYDQIQYMKNTGPCKDADVPESVDPLFRIETSYFEEYYEDLVKDLNEDDLILNNNANFHGWRCKAGIDNIFVNSLGQVLRATCLEGGVLGYIQDPDNIKWPQEDIICGKKWCGCHVDIRIEKELVSTQS